MSDELMSCSFAVLRRSRLLGFFLSRLLRIKGECIRQKTKNWRLEEQLYHAAEFSLAVFFALPAESWSSNLSSLPLVQHLMLSFSLVIMWLFIRAQLEEG